MIIVNLMGGLGNQMFQYACGLALSNSVGENVLYSTDIYRQQSTFNGFELDKVFGLELPIARRSDLVKIMGRIASNPYMRRAMMKAQILEILMPNTVIFERNFSFQADLEAKLSNGGYLHGYWQSECYFKDVAEEVRKKFRFMGIENTSLVKTGKINVSLHVRRGDYLNSGTVMAPCDADYYHRALEALGLPLRDFVLYVFSDDPNWAKNEISRLHPDCRIVYGNEGIDSYKDMYLMSECDHHIIANSSFSWWGAWLNPSLNKRVIAPKQWFSDPVLSCNQIIPSAWQRV